MRPSLGVTIAAAIITATIVFAAFVTHAQQPAGPIRTVLLCHETTASGYEAVLVEVELPVGAREGRHTHPGLVIGRVAQGTLTLDYEGRPTTEYKAGQSFFFEAGKVHEGMNMGTVPMKALVTFVVKQGEVLTTPVPATVR